MIAFEFKIVVYCVTIAAALFFGFWELRLKQQITDEALPPSKNASDFGTLNDLSESFKRERFLSNLPLKAVTLFRMIVALKFTFVALLVIEVIALQR